MKRSFSIRIEESVLNRLRRIANEEERSINRQIALLIERYVEKYEMEQMERERMQEGNKKKRCKRTCTS